MTFVGSRLQQLQYLTVDELNIKLKATSADEERLTVLTALGWVIALNDVALAENYTAQAKSLNKHVNDDMFGAHILANEARCMVYRSRYHDALQLVEQARLQYQVLGDDTYRGGGVAMIYAHCYTHLQDKIQAQHWAEVTLNIGEMIQDNHVITHALNILGALAATNDNPQLARHWFEQCLTYYLPQQNHRYLGRTYNNIGLTYLHESRFEEAKTSAQLAIHHHREAHYPRGEMHTLNLLGEIAIKQHDIEAIIENYSQVVTLAESFDYFGMELMARYQLAYLKQQNGQISEAMRDYLNALERCPDDFETESVSNIHERLAECFEQLGDYQQAIKHLRIHSRIKLKLNNAQVEKQMRQSHLELEATLARKEAEETRRQLEHADRVTALGKMAAGIAHEINNPIQVVYMNLLLLSREHDTPAIQRSVEQIERVTRLVASMREMYQFETLEEQLIDCSEMVQNVMILMSRPLGEVNITVETDLADNLPLILASPTQIQQVIFNLILNARDAMPEGGTLRLVTAHDTLTNDIMLRVSDTGEGIASDDLKRVFDPFFTTRIDGSGLGLAICQNIISHYGGTITATSEGAGLGTQLEVRYKVKKDDKS